MTALLNPVTHRTTLRHVLESRLAAGPGTVVIQTEDGVELTRRDLLEELRRRARRIDRVAGSDGFVEIIGDGGLETSLSCLAVVMSGRAYAVVAPQWPDDFRERLRARLRPVATVVTARDHHVVETTRWSGLSPRQEAPAEPGEQPCCVFFTSGSTGEPKGVVIPHRALLRTCDTPAFLDIERPLRMPQLAPLTWDAGALELWAPLLNGGTCLIPTAGAELLHSLRWAVGTGGASAMWLTASLGNLVIDAEVSLLAELEMLLVGGERLSEGHIRRLASHVPSLRIVNGYGPVESTVFATTHEIDPTVDLRGAGVPLGRPIAATSVVVVDGEGHEVPVGSSGEIVIRGDGVALGYLGVEPDEDGRCGGFRRRPDGLGLEYHTGDVGVIRADGVLEFHGRRDAEVKVSGVRIDVAGLERRIMSVDGVRQAAVVRQLDPESNALALAARVVAEPARAHDVLAAIDADLQHLPSGSRPLDIRLVDELPRTASGKVDRAAVERELQQGRSDQTHVDEQFDPVERSVRATLGAVDLTRSLVELGTSSLLAMRLASALRAASGRDVPVAELYRLESLDAIPAWLAGRSVVQTAPRTANLATEIAERYWTSEAIVPRSEAHLVFCAFRGRTGELPAVRIEAAIRDAARRYLLGVRGISARLGGVVRTAEVDTEVDVEVDDVLWRDDLSRARDLASTATGLHDLSKGPMLAFAAAPIGDSVAVLGVFHHAIVDGEALRTVGHLLDHAFNTSVDTSSAPLGSVLCRTVEWTDGDVEYWRTVLGGAPRLEIEGATCRNVGEVWRSRAHQHVREISAPVQARVAAARVEARSPELAAWVHVAVNALRGELGVESICLGTMVRAGEDDGHPRGCAAQPVPLVIGAGDVTLDEVSSAVLTAFDHASVPYSEVLRAAEVDDRLGPYRVIVNLQDERARGTDRTDWLPRSLAPSGPVTELYLEFVLRDDEPPFVRVVTPESEPYVGLGTRIADRIADGSK